MKRIFSVCTILLVFFGLLSCKTPPAAGQSEIGSSVWKVSKNGNTLFLGGSIHILRDIDFPLPKEFDDAFSQSEVLVLEADIDQIADTQIAEYLMSRMILPDNKTLQSVLDSDTYELLETACYEYGIPLDAVSAFKPSMIMNMLAMFQIQKFGFVQQGVDGYYLDRAKQQNKPIVFLETVQTQIDALVTMGDGYENEYVRYSMADMTTTEQELAMLVAEWKKGASSSTEAASTEMKEQWPDIYKTLVADRNAAWIPQIVEYLATGRVYFVIVGLMHLHGPDGLLRQLKDKGYRVEQLGY